MTDPEGKNLLIGGLDTQELGLLPQLVKITQPKPKTNYVDIPGSDNYLDFTEAYGTTFYYPRKDSQIILDYIGDYDAWEETISRLARAIQGRRVKLILGWEPEFYYIGRFDIEPRKDNDAVGEIKIFADLDAYKRRNQETRAYFTVSGNAEFTVHNLFEPVVPKITASGSITLQGNGETVELTPGTARYQEFILHAGGNTFTASGTGTVEFIYTEGTL